SSVDLPQPLDPTMLTNSPGSMVSEMSCSTGRASPLTSYCLFSPWMARVPACAMVFLQNVSVPRHRVLAPGQQPFFCGAEHRVQGKAHQADHDHAEQDQVHLEVLAAVDQCVADALARREQVLGAQRGEPGVDQREL